MFGATAPIDQVLILQTAIEAFENVGVDLDIRGVAHALSVDETRIVTNGLADTQVNGTSGIDFFYITPGDHTFDGGAGADNYFVGKNSGNDTIIDYGHQDTNQLIFTSVKASDVYATREGQDLLIRINSSGSVIRVSDEFLGELNPLFSDGTTQTSGVYLLVFRRNDLGSLPDVVRSRPPGRYRRSDHRIGAPPTSSGRQGQ